MKQLIRTFLLLHLCVYCSCDGINSYHEEYLDRGEAIYTGLVDSLSVSVGNECARFKWLLNADPRITHVLLYWNNYKDSVKIEVDRTTVEFPWMICNVEIPEDEYVFNVKTTDNRGHYSMPVEVSAKVYGPSYIENLSNRSIRKCTINEYGIGTIKWFAVDTNTLLYTLVKYWDYSNAEQPVEKKVRVDNTEFETVLNGARKGDKIYVSSCFMPESSFDVFYSIDKEYIFN